MHLSTLLFLLALFAGCTYALEEIGKYDTPPGGVEYTGEETELWCAVGTHCPKDRFCCAPDVECVNGACPVEVNARYTGGNWINGELIFKRSQRVKRSRGKQQA